MKQSLSRISVRAAKADGMARLADGLDGKAQDGRGGGSATILSHDQGSATASVTNSLEEYKTVRSVRSLPSFAALALCLSASSVTNAAIIAPVSSAFIAPGTISVSLPASLNLPVTRNITFEGKTAVDGSYASIDNVTVSDSNALYSMPQMTGLPRKLTVSSVTADKVNGAGSKILSSTCSPSTVNGSWSNATDTLSANNQSLAGNYKINSLSAKPTPAFVVNP